MESPIIALPYWMEDRVNIHGLTANGLIELENNLSDDELLWVLSLHKLKPFSGILTELGSLHDSERMRKLSEYELGCKGVTHGCVRYLNAPPEVPMFKSIKLKLVTTSNLHIMVISHATAPEDPIRQLAKQYSDNTCFTQMLHAADGLLLTQYIN